MIQDRPFVVYSGSEGRRNGFRSKQPIATGIRLLTAVGVVVLIALLTPTSRADLVANADTAGAGPGQVTLSGGTTLVGGVLNFPLEGDFARINGFGGFSGTEDWSVSFWVNNSLPFDRDMIGFDADKMYIRTDNDDQGAGNTRFRIDASGGDQTPGGPYTNISDNTWHHLGIINDSIASQIGFYVDGNLTGNTPTTTWNLNGGDVYLGGSPGGKTDMAGQMQGLGFYDIALDPDDFTGLTLGQRPIGDGDPPPPPPQPIIPNPDSMYADPAAVGEDAGWNYVYSGTAGANLDTAALDGTWSHDNGSDAWDGSAIGSGRPGGVLVRTEDESTYVRIQDAGDPRDYAFADPGSNRKEYFTHGITSEGASASVLDDGVTLSFRARLATDGPLDDVHADGGGVATSWPENGNGYVLHDGGKGAFGLKQANGGIISFALATATEDNAAGHNGVAGLIMNNLNGAAVSGDVDQQTADGGTVNVLPLDPTDWHEFWVTIAAGGNGTHQVSVYMDGALEPAATFDVTAGSGSDAANSYIALGAGATPQHGATDVDFFAWKSGAFVPTSAGIPGDYNLDGVVDRADAVLFAGTYGPNGTNALIDLVSLQANLGQMAASPAAVPEPSSLALVFFGLIAVGARRRKRKQ